MSPPRATRRPLRTPSTERQAFRLDEVARAWGVSRSSVERAIRDGTLTAFRVGRVVLVPAAALASAERRNRVGGAA